MALIDFNTSCPWELYLFALVNIIGALAMYLMDACQLLTATACTDTEKVTVRFAAMCMLYVGVVYTVLTYHSKHSADKVTRLSNFALNCSVALLVSCVFAGNASLGGIERSWMHIGDVLSMIILVCILSARVAKTGAEWAQTNNFQEELGVNCKTLLLFFIVLTAIKFLAYTDFIDPMKLLADGEMTAVAQWMWNFVAVSILELLLAMFYSVLFDDNAGQELLVVTIVVMSLIAAGSIVSVQQYMSTWMGLNSNAIWIRVGVLIAVCLIAIAGGRRGSSDRTGYSAV